MRHQPNDLRLVTFNAHHLRDAARATRYLRTVQAITAPLTDEGESPWPEVLATQEIESMEASEAWAAGLNATHHTLRCTCAQNHIVALAVSRQRFEVHQEACISLGQLFIDHPRCAARIDVEDPRTHQPMTFLSVHAAWHWNNHANAETLLDAMPDAAFIALGDWNADEGSDLDRTFAMHGLHTLEWSRAGTHASGMRLDAIYAPSAWRLVDALTRQQAFDLVAPVASDEVICTRGACSISDHLPISLRVHLQAP